jgi:hypothetical protein
MLECDMFAHQISLRDLLCYNGCGEVLAPSRRELFFCHLTAPATLLDELSEEWMVFSFLQNNYNVTDNLSTSSYSDNRFFNDTTGG